MDRSCAGLDAGSVRGSDRDPDLVETPSEENVLHRFKVGNTDFGACAKPVVCVVLGDELNAQVEKDLNPSFFLRRLEPAR